jgi:hypothetical protein
VFLDAQNSRGKLLSRAGRQNVIDEPVPIELPEGRIPQKAGGKQHFVCGLEHTLEVRWIALGEGELLRQ